MIDGRREQHRRIDRMLAPGFLASLPDRPLAEVRALRDAAAQEETDLSFIRRQLHGRIDIVRAEQRRRAEGGQADVVSELAAILADNTIAPESGSGRLQTLEPSRADSHRRYVESLVADVDLTDVGSLSDSRLAAALDAYTTEERAFSQRRREVQALLDGINAEIAERYRTGAASADDLLAQELLDAYQEQRLAEPTPDEDPN